jgi:chromosome segregation ATPase
MAKKKDTSIDDLAESIWMLATAMDKGFTKIDERFDKVDGQFAGVNKRLDGLTERMDAAEALMRQLEANQRETNERLERPEGNQQATEDDVKELYRMIGGLRQDFDKLNEKEQERFANLEHFARRVSRKTKIPFSVT